MASQAWSTATSAELKKIKGVCLDIDETLSTRGKLTAEAYVALWKLKETGLWVVPITGRPAGWCDQIARFWPVNAVVGENGAFTFFMNDGVRKRINTPGAASDPQIDLAALGEKVRKKFPKAKWASDQSYREYDLAIDICEDVPHWKEEDIQTLLELCRAAGAHAKLSSIHVNSWFGDYDKTKGFSHWLAQTEGAPARDEWLFIGDSPNDEPMFATFPQSVGVANIKPYLSKIQSPPKWITEKESGSGFVEMSAKLIAAHRLP